MAAQAELTQRLARQLETHRQAVLDQVAGMMKNPDSAKFRAVKINPKSLAVCGHVNATNGFGGYGGEMKFVAVSDMVYVIKSAEDNQTGATVFAEHCEE